MNLHQSSDICNSPGKRRAEIPAKVERVRETTRPAPRCARVAGAASSNEPAAAPVMVSQRNCEAVLGTNPRRFLELVRRHPELPRLRNGTKLVLVPVASIVALARPAEPAESAQEPAPAETADDILAELGKRRVRGSR